ncbi:hypothetical protein CFOL_v3_03832 [Cephalotus follicularis]|uniref:Uncharacterized protein n=1 Tax=Cephalotus follicularis TaxID=3775 RepID=A0A1Q3AX28_CEPFO|nr:hypothetical protein CFOL_v3_03832 [Cephalotus follicularis]
MSNRKPLMNITNDANTCVLSTPILDTASPLSSSHGKMKNPLHKPKEGESMLLHEAFNHCHLLETEIPTNSPLLVNTTPFVSFSRKENVLIHFDGLPSGIAMLSGVQECFNSPKVKGGSDEAYKPQENPRNESLLLDCSELKLNDTSPCFSNPVDQEWTDCQWELSGGYITDTDDSYSYLDARDNFQEDADGLVVGERFDEMCHGLGMMSLKEKRMNQFTGKNIRFIYGSHVDVKEEDYSEDDEIYSYYDCKSNVVDDDDDVVGREGGGREDLFGSSTKDLP